MNAARTDNGMTTLMVACSFGHLDIIHELLKKGALVNTASFFGRTSLMSASMNGHSSVAAFLLQRSANPDMLDFMGKDALALASTDDLRLLLKK